VPGGVALGPGVGRGGTPGGWRRRRSGNALSSTLWHTRKANHFAARRTGNGKSCACGDSFWRRLQRNPIHL
jgi:hypothetical protein